MNDNLDIVSAAPAGQSIGELARVFWNDPLVTIHRQTRDRTAI